MNVFTFMFVALCVALCDVARIHVPALAVFTLCVRVQVRDLMFSLDTHVDVTIIIAERYCWC